MKLLHRPWLFTVGAMALAPAVVSAQDDIDCTSQYLTRTSPPTLPNLVLEYTPDLTAGVLRGRVTHEGLGWVGFAVSDETGSMINSHAVLGLPEAGTAERYLLGGLAPSAVVPLEDQSGLTATIVQNETHTVLEFAVSLADPVDAVYNIDPNGRNNFLVAAGPGNDLAYHGVNRALLVETLVGCGTAATAEGTTVQDEMVVTDEMVVEDEMVVTDNNIMNNNDNNNVTVGDTVTHEGYVLDRFCIDQGVFLDQPEVASLSNPDQHTVHCLIDAPPCIASEFELLAEPPEAGADYTRAYTLDEASKELVVALAKELGGSSCTDCDGTGNLLKGLRVRVTGTVTALGDPAVGHGPVLSVTEATAVFPFVGQTIEHEGYVLDRFCIDQGFFLDQPDVASLSNPSLHTVHCLIDAPPCIASVYELLGPPEADGDDYTRAYVLDDASKDLVVAVAKDLGGPSCTECNGVGHLTKGLRVAVEATIVALGGEEEDAPDAGPVLSVTDCGGVFPFAGQTIALDGVFISDQFCLERGTFLDNDLPSLEQPEKHTIHCLIDPPPCISSPFEVLLDPLEGETMHQRGYTLDQASKDFFVDIIKTVGVCDECTGEGSLVEGFRAALVATIADASRNETSGSGPLISVTSGEAVLPEVMAPVYEVGQQITVEGYVTDQFCILRGSFLDTGLPTLENVDRHTLHCLLDPPPCLGSPFEILMDPDFSMGETEWSRGFTLDDDAKQQVIELGRSIGNCDTCEGGETGQVAGLRVRLEATIVDNMFNMTSGAGPLISVQSVESVGQYSVGQEIMVEGYIIDQFCIDRGTFLDTGLATLENADKHTVHCLIDPPQCSSAVYEVLLDPVGESTTWSRGFTLDADSKAELVALAMEVGDCDLCTGEGTLKAGFRAKLTATVVDNMRNLTSGAGPIISVSRAEHVVPEVPEGTFVVGQEIQVDGYITDRFCIERGTFLDTGLVTLENVDKHTVHCLLDPEPCITSVFEVLLEPLEGETLFRRVFVLDEASKELLVGIARDVGMCDTCTGEGTLEAGFKASITATIVALTDETSEGSGPIISVTSAEAILPVGECAAVSGPTTIAVENTPIMVTYELGADDAGMATFSATVEYEGLGWVGFAISVDGKMQGSLAVIGLPDEDVGASNPGKYDLESLAPSGVVLADQQTLIDGNIEQNETHTVLTFTKLVEEEGELPINPTGNNFFLVAAGSSNELAYHAVRQPFEVALGCGSAKPELAMPNLAVGDIVTVEGFVMDNFCIERGTLLDEPQIVTLEEPNLHTLHCLIDVPQCAASNYEILMDPLPGETLYRRALTLDDASKEQVRMMAQAIGKCDTCGGGRRLQDSGRVERGFRASVTAEVTALSDASTGAPPMVALSDVNPVLFITDASTQVTLEVGDLVTVEGFIMDYFCIERGTLLDAPSVVTLQEPNRHSLHCLIDVPQCVATNYEVLLDPVPGMEDPMYTRGFVLDDEGKALVTALAKEVGVCSDCDGTGDWEFGFRARIQGTVVELGADGEPPLISVQQATPVPFDGMTGEAAETEPPVTPTATTGDGPIDCSEFQSSLSFPGTDLTMNYVVVVDEATGIGNFSAEVVYEGQGWVGWAVSETGSMVGSLSVIGRPDDNKDAANPGKYDLGGQSVAAVTLTDQQTLLDGDIVQNDTHTVLTFTKLLSEPGEIEINPNGNNFFLVASGSGNDLNIHLQRAAASITLAPCTAESGGAAGGAQALADPRRESHYKAHGWMAGIAWGILVPLAISSSLCRHLIPAQGLWFELHRALNSLALVMTLIAFAIIVNELEKNTPEPNHFEPIEGGGAIGKHKTIGLVVFITSLIQGIGGILRPHNPEAGEEKSSVRVFWEFAHKGSGVAILAMAWYQCHSGLVTYMNNFDPEGDDYTDVFWGVTGAISAIGVVGGLSRLAMPADESGGHSPVPKAEGEEPEEEHPTAEHPTSWHT